MTERIKKLPKETWGILALTCYTWIATFLSEKYIFYIEERAAYPGDYILCKGLQFVFLFLLYRFVYRALIDKNREKNEEYRIAGYALVYLLFIIVYYLIKAKLEFRGDELNIFTSARAYQDMSGWFNYQTGYFHMISLMTFPVYHGPVIAKFILQSLIIGYLCFRYRKYYANYGFLLIYVLFMGSKAMLGQGMNMSRTPIYGIIYAFFIGKLLFDYLEQRETGRWNLIGMSIIGALMTQWRNEGIGLLVFLPVIYLLAYRERRVLKTVLVMLAVQLLVFIPQAVDTYAADETFVTTRMRPFYNYVMTNMLRNGLDREEYREELAAVDKYVSIEAIDRINEDFGRNAYDDEYVFWMEGYKGIREEATLQDYVNYTEAAMKIIVGEPLLFAKSQIGAWNYTSTRYFPTSKSKLSQWYRFFSFELYVPTLVTLLVFIGALIKKRWFHFFLTGAVLCQTGITVILMPAAIFNYFYVIYVCGYLYLSCCLIYYFKKQRCRSEKAL